MKSNVVLFLAFMMGIMFCSNAIAQTISKEELIFLTSEWKGERFPDGRPKIPDDLITRAKNIYIDDAWTVLKNEGYLNQFEGNWKMVNNDVPVIGRAVTAMFMPTRPDIEKNIKARGTTRDGRKGNTNSWPIETLTKGDVYVADGFGKVKDGTLIGSSLGNAIYGKTGKGVIFYGSVRDMQELKDTKGFNAWVKGQDPSFIKDMTPTSINAPIRIGQCTVFPGDVAFANEYGVVFIPAYLVPDLVLQSELTGYRDEFERYMLQLGKYPSGQIHGDWSDTIKNEFRSWIAKYPKKLTVTQQEIENYLSKEGH